MTKTTKRGTLSEAEFLKNIEDGVFDDRIDTFMPPEMYGPPTEAELAAAAREQAKRSRTNGRARQAPARKPRARRAGGKP